jgi:hypothetical protein
MANFPSGSARITRSGPRFSLQVGALVVVLLAFVAASFFALPGAPLTNLQLPSVTLGSGGVATVAGRSDETTVLALAARHAAAEAPSSLLAQVGADAPTRVLPVSPGVADAAASAAVPPVERWRGAGIVLVTEGQEWDAESLANVDAALAAMPAHLLGKLGNPALGPLHVLVNSHGRTISGKQPYGGPANFFSTNDGINELVLYPRQRIATVIHELGHAYNLRRTAPGRYALVLLDPEMQGFLAATGWRVLSPAGDIQRAVDHMKVQYAYNGSFTWPRVSNMDPLEDFANSFALFYMDPSGLMAASPERYQWFEVNVGR